MTPLVFILFLLFYLHRTFSLNHTRVYNTFVTKQYCMDEYESLESIRRTYQCTCGRNAYHFPKILRSGYGRVWLTHCGTDLSKFTPDSLPSDKMDQVRCIRDNLRRANLAHMDVKDQNMCVDKSGVIFLIDFDSVYSPDFTMIGTNTCPNKRKDHRKLLWTQQKLDEYMNKELDYKNMQNILEGKQVISPKQFFSNQ